MLTITDLFNLNHTIAKDYLTQFTYPWEALAGIQDFILWLRDMWQLAREKLFPKEVFA